MRKIVDAVFMYWVINDEKGSKQLSTYIRVADNDSVHQMIISRKSCRANVHYSSNFAVTLMLPIPLLLTDDPIHSNSLGVDILIEYLIK